jgi:hypothetical protein
MAQKYRVSEVFVPGGLPTYTYVPRSIRGLEEGLANACDNLCKIATVTGATKSGKTVLVRKVLATAPRIWIDGGHINSISEFWDHIGDQLNVVEERQDGEVEENGSEIGGEFSAEANAIVVKGSGKVSGKVNSKSATHVTRKKITYKPAQISRSLLAKKLPVVIDDFHYLNRTIQGEITRALKPLVFEGLPVIYLAIPHRRYDAVKVEREMNGRIELIPVPSWDVSELVAIAQQGFPLLNVKPDEVTSKKLGEESHGSPHLMQEFCKKICSISGIKETPDVQRSINPTFNYNRIFEEVARDLGKNIYDKLAKGPRPRSDRLQRKLKNGGSVDIYKVVLLALAKLKPGVITIEYEPLRVSIRDILEGDLPQAHEVSRVLEQMAKVSSLDESSVPVIDYEKDDRKLHITDPFFAFFLKWGSSLIGQD